MAFLPPAWRFPFLRLEALLDRVPLHLFEGAFFCYDATVLMAPLIIPFQRYLLRLDVFSFFFLWTAMEYLRISLYNSYIRAHPALSGRSFLRRALIQTWYPRRRCYLEPIHFLPLHLLPWDRRPMRRLLFERFTIMFKARKYMILTLLKSKVFQWREVKLPSDLQLLIRKDAFVSWLCALNPSQLAAKDFLRPWDGPQLSCIYFVFFMHHPKTFYPMDKWHLEKYRQYLLRSLQDPWLDHVIGWSTVDYAARYRKAFYQRIVSDALLQNAFALRDLYTYSSFSWESFTSFIDRHFCYRIFTMKYNWFFDSYFLQAQRPYMVLHSKLNRPFLNRGSTTYSIGRGRAMVFARRFLLRFCSLPQYFSYTLLGLEYFYWRIHEQDAVATWRQDVLPLAYYYVKLNIDKLITSRHRTLIQRLRLSLQELYPSLHSALDAFYFKLRNRAVYEKKYWVERQLFYVFNVWTLLHFAALRSIFLQALNQNFLLASLHLCLLHSILRPFVLRDLQFLYLRRFNLCLQHIELFNRFLLADQQLFIPLGVDWLAPRAKKWLSPFNLNAIAEININSRYSLNYTWKLVNKQEQLD